MDIWGRLGDFADLTPSSRVRGDTEATLEYVVHAAGQVTSLRAVYVAVPFRSLSCLSRKVAVADRTESDLDIIKDCSRSLEKIDREFK
jgi:hypothetical protein